MPIYLIASGVLLVTPIAAATAIVIYALRTNRDVSASFWSKRFGFTLSAKDRPAASPPQSQEKSALDTQGLRNMPSVPDTAPVMPDQSMAALQPRE